MGATAAVTGLDEQGDLDADRRVRRDQLQAVRHSVLGALPVNLLLGLASWAVAVHAGKGWLGLGWFAASSAVNAARAVLCRLPCAGLEPGASGPAAGRAVEQHLRWGRWAALLSGLVWACVPVLCDGYTTPQTLFYLAVTCGITAGAVTYGTAYAAIPIAFITPPLLSVAACLFAVGDVDRVILALTVLLYLLALIKGTRATDRVFRDASRAKNEARAAADSREVARRKASALAAEMERRATHDDLTGLLSRGGFAAGVERQLAGAPARPCLMLLDLDGFKAINDVYGHKAGDRVLAEVARRLGAVLPPCCLAGRLGGDEFAVFFDAATAPEPPAALAARLIDTVARPHEGFTIGRLGISIGVDDTGTTDLTSLLSCADEALYAAKKSGRNRVHLFDEDLRGRVDMRRTIKRDLSGALAHGGMEVWFQPIFGGGGQVLSGFEALLRWRHPVHGWVPPDQIVSQAGLTGLTEALFRFILERVGAMGVALRSADRPGLRVAMNVSPREMAQIAVDEIILEALHTRGLPAHMLEIEITEEVAADIGAVDGKLRALAGAGIAVALDDFGAGYASLGSLQQLRAGRLKIDRSLVHGLGQDDGRRRLVEAVLGLGRSLGLEVVAEGIETAEDLAALRAAGCQFMQGYLLGRAMPFADAVALAGRSA